MSKMKIGFIGLGKMGSGIAQQLVEKGHVVIALKRRETDLIRQAEKTGVQTVSSLSALIKSLPDKKIVWTMVTAGGSVDEVIFDGKDALIHHLKAGDIVIEAANSEFWESQRRAADLAKKKIDFVDAGVSGGPAGARNGAAVMVGGEEKTVKQVEQLFKDVSVEGGYLHVGSVGSGHFVKMVHNAIEYGMMQSLAEGMELVKEGPYRDLDLLAISQMWNHGTVVRGFLMEKMIQALEADKDLIQTDPYPGDLGETRWAIKTAIDSDIPFDSASRALFARFRARQQTSFAAKVIQALRGAFGGHKREDTIHGKFSQTDKK